MIKPKPKVVAPHLTSNFWSMPDYARQRMTVQEWRAILLNEGDVVTIAGRIRRLVAKRLGAGVVEVTVAPLSEKP